MGSECFRSLIHSQCFERGCFRVAVEHGVDVFHDVAADLEELTFVSTTGSAETEPDTKNWIGLDRDSSRARVRLIITSYDSIIVRTYCRIRFVILNLRFFGRMGSVYPPPWIRRRLWLWLRAVLSLLRVHGSRAKNYRRGFE